MLLEFSSDRAPGPPQSAARLWERSSGPGGVVFVAGVARLTIDNPARWGGALLIVAGIELLNRRRRPATVQEPRRCRSDIPLTASFDVPRDVLTPDQDAQLRMFLDRRGLLPPG